MQNRYRKYLFLQLIVVVLVVLTFRVAPEPRWASLLATSLFLFGAGAVIVTEVKSGQRLRSWSLVSTSLFVVVFVLPIIVLRWLSWSGSFAEETLLGVSGAQFHRFSNWAFMAMLGCYFFESLKAAKSQS